MSCGARSFSTCEINYGDTAEYERASAERPSHYKFVAPPALRALAKLEKGHSKIQKQEGRTLTQLDMLDTRS